MEKAIQIVEMMIAESEQELSKIRDRYARTNPNDIYDADYRVTLSQMVSRELRTLRTLEDVKARLEVADDIH